MRSLQMFLYGSILWDWQNTTVSQTKKREEEEGATGMAESYVLTAAPM